MTLFFMHVPKTAGTSFRRFLAAAVEAADGRPAPVTELYPDYDRFLACGARLAREYDLVCGHYPYHVLELFPRGSRAVTVLRDPIERCLSHIKHQIEHERQTGEGCGVRDVNAFIELPVNRFFLATLRNLTVKYLAFRGHPNTPVEEERLSLDLALARAGRSWVGFEDELEAFGRRLAERAIGAGAPPPGLPPLARENASTDPAGVEDLTRRNHETLRRLNALDLRLYERLYERRGRGLLPFFN